MATLDAKAHLHEHGWVRIPGVLSKAEAAGALARLWAAKDKYEKEGMSAHLAFLDPNASNVRVFYLMAYEAIFRELIAHPAAVDMVKTVLGDNFVISNFTANVARPGSESMALHSDQSLVFPEPWNTVWATNIIWCLTDVNEANGATRYIPGSNKWTTRDQIPADAPAHLVPFEAEAGDMLVMNGRLWHTSGANTTKDEERALLFGYYTKPFVRQQVNWAVKLPRDVQDRLDPQLRTWLGMDADANMLADEGDFSFKYLGRQFPAEKAVT